MPIVFAVVIVALALLIAWAIVGRATLRDSGQVTSIAFDVDSVVAWIGDHLPESDQGLLSYEDVRRIVEWNLEFMKSRGAIANGHKPDTSGPVIIGGAETAEFILSKAESAGMEVSATQIHSVLDAQIAYFEYIGAVGPQADETPDV